MKTRSEVPHLMEQTVTTVAVEVDPADTVNIYQWLSQQTAPRIFWQDRNDMTFAGAGAAAVIQATHEESRFDAIHTAAEQLFSNITHIGPEITRPRVFGGFSFDSKHVAKDHWSDFPAGYFVLPEQMLIRNGEHLYLVKTVVDTEPHDPSQLEVELKAAATQLPESYYGAEQPPAIETTTIIPNKEEWIQIVTDAVSTIDETQLQKIVVATAMDVSLNNRLDIPTILRQFSLEYPKCYHFLIQPSAKNAFFGPPPERLLAVDDMDIATEALAGSAPRGDTEKLDQQYADSLLSSEKTRHEQQLVTDTITSALQSFGSVTTEDRSVKKFNNIQHLHTPISANATSKTHILDILSMLHPSPAVGGLPKELALRTIQELEPFQRGWYASPVGWFDADGYGEFAVGIRSGVNTNSKLRLFAGNGIVSDSVPEEEWEEVNLKYDPVLTNL
ncbi:isochorismate synthase [Salinarchaeum sp. IM2453]|uniref:isochorismate synthase n=1 Tax=Salinarchaeum sp. IM2453 TaxID=2862870 RepID=UPI001C8285F4|nr:isochorismate synthase [Salinarchaeum sp. IM2453]QZA88135.1 isochorismate synthase [Salinarchaeum sp. IM2453]